MLVPENKDYRKDGNGGGSRPLDINSPIYYGGVPKGINITFLEVKIVVLFVVVLLHGSISVTISVNQLCLLSFRLVD